MKHTYKRLLVLALLVAVSATPALAMGPGSGGEPTGWGPGPGPEGEPVRWSPGPGPVTAEPESFSLTGIIAAKESGFLTVQVHNGSILVKPYIGLELQVLLTEGTGYRQWGPLGCTPISWDDVPVGATTSIQGLVSEGVFTARRVTVDVPCCP